MENESKGRQIFITVLVVLAVLVLIGSCLIEDEDYDRCAFCGRILDGHNASSESWYLDGKYYCTSCYRLFSYKYNRDITLAMLMKNISK